MDFFAFSRVLTRNILTRRQALQVHQQCRCYRPIKLSNQMSQRLDRHRKPFVPGETGNEEFVQDWQKAPEKVAEYKRLAWAKFGSSSGVDISSILPTKKELEEEWEAEKRWWPTLQEMQENIKAKKEKAAAKKAAYDKKVAENMAKMPKWIAEWEAQQAKDAEKEEIKKVEKEIYKEKVLEKINYKMESSSLKFKKLLQEEIDKDKELKRKAKKAEKRLKKEAVANRANDTA